MRAKKNTAHGNATAATNISKPPYICPRCGYRVVQRIDMRCHFYCRSTGPCNGLVNDITLTDHIKNKVLENRVYVVQSEDLLSVAANNVTHNENLSSVVASGVTHNESLSSVATNNVTHNESLSSVATNNVTHNLQNYSCKNESGNENISDTCKSRRNAHSHKSSESMKRSNTYESKKHRESSELIKRSNTCESRKNVRFHESNESTKKANTHENKITGCRKLASGSEIILDTMAPVTIDVYEKTNAAVETVDETCKKRRYRSQSKSRNGIGILYVYQIIPIYQTRAEVYKYLSRTIKRNLPPSVIISKDDLNGLVLIKSGRSKYTVVLRIEDYTRSLCSELYKIDKVNACEFVVEYGDLEDAEKAILTKIQKSNQGADEMAGLLLDNDELIWPREVFRVKSIDTVHSQVKEAIAEYQAKLSVNSVNSTLYIEQTKLKQMELEKELKQLELESKRMEIENSSKLELLKILRDKGASIEQIMQAFQLSKQNMT